MNLQYATRMEGIKPSAIRSLNTNPKMIFFGGGYPDGDLFPLDALKRAFEDAITHSGKEALQYSFSVGFGFLAALGQAVGSIIVRPVMEAGIDPFLASLLRVGTAACCLSMISVVPISTVRPRNRLTWQTIALTALSGFLSLAMGMTLLLFALSGGETGVVSTISATTPVIILPLLWLRTGQRPTMGAWTGAVLVVVGLAFIMRP